MYNIFLYIHIKKRAKKNRLLVPLSEIHKKLHKIISMHQIEKCKIIFLLWKAGFSKSIEATAIFPYCIICSYEWAVQLIIGNEEDVINSFLITLGHELAHKDGDYAFLCWDRKNKHYIHKKYRKFVNWVTEVHHDFAAAQKMADSSKEKLLASIDFKIKLKPDSEDSLTHPSWQQRKAYAEMGAFNKELIEMIAIDTGCTDKDLMNDVVDYYQEIVLKI